jgi:hypothetical protein
MNVQMPYQLIWESPDTMRCHFSGRVDVANLNDATNDFYNDSRSDCVTRAFWDFSAMTQFAVDRAQVSEIAFSDHAASCYMKPMKAAFITANAEFAELARLYIAEMEQLGGDWRNRLFASLGEARVWMACPPEQGVT